jgi:hypothetical protein
MALASGALGTCVCAIETRKPSCIGRLARYFFTLGTWPTRSRGMHASTRTLPGREAGSEAIGHAAAPEPTSAER